LSFAQSLAVLTLHTRVCILQSITVLTMGFLPHHIEAARRLLQEPDEAVLREVHARTDALLVRRHDVITHSTLLQNIGRDSL